jgi:hypothetical protein
MRNSAVNSPLHRNVTKVPQTADGLLLPNVKVGEQAFVKAENIRTTRPSKKLSEKSLGPFDIIARPGTHSVTLRLPDHLRAIHPVFHVSQLEPATPNTILNHTQPLPPPIEINGEIEYEIVAILDSKIDNRQKCRLLYFVRWAGYEGTDEEHSWLPATELEHAQELLSDFHTQYPWKPGPLPIFDPTIILLSRKHHSPSIPLRFHSSPHHPTLTIPL